MESHLSAQHLRELIRSREWTKPTSGAATGYVQANLVMLPQEAAFDFLLFCVRNPKPCPILDVLEPGQVEPHIAHFRERPAESRSAGRARLLPRRHGELPAGLQLFI